MSIDLKVTDGVDSRIATKLNEIGAAAATADAKVRALQKIVNSVNGKNIKSVSAAALNTSRLELNASKIAVNNARANKESEQALLIAERRKALADKTASDLQRKSIQNTSLAQTEAQKVARETLKTANAQADTMVKQAQARAKQAEADVKTQYQYQLAQHTGNMASNVNKLSNARVQNAQAAVGNTQARGDLIMAQTQLATDRAAEATARKNRIDSEAAVVQQRLATETARTAAANQNAAAAAARAAAAQARANAAASRTTTTLNSVRSASSNATGGILAVGSAMGQLERSASFLRSDGLRWAKVLWALGGATLTAHALTGAIDAYTRLQNRLTVVAPTQEKVNYLTDEMLQLANASRQPIEATAKTFSRLDLAMQQMGRSQSQTIELTGVITKALKLSGATAGEASSAMLQLSQAFNKGKLDGDEFRSVMENAPLLADALAKQLNVTRGELLKLAPEGKITAIAMADAFLKARKDIEAQFGKLRVTIAESFVVFRNSATVFFGELDKSLGISAALGNAIVFLANNLDVLTFAFMALIPVASAFIGAKLVSGFGLLITYSGRTAIAIGAIRSPITIVAQGLTAMATRAVASGRAMSAAFTGATAKAIALQLAVVRGAAAMAALSTVATRAGGAMVAAFSFGNVLLLLGTLIAAAISFGDALVMSAESGATLRDYTIAALEEVGGFIGDLAVTGYNKLAEFFGLSGGQAKNFGDVVKNVLDNGSALFAAFVDASITVTTILWRAIKTIWWGIYDTIANVMKTATNLVTAVVNGWIEIINTALRLIGKGDSAIKTYAYQEVSIKRTEEAANELVNSKSSTAAMEALGEFKKRVAERGDARAAKRKKDANMRAYDPAQEKRYKDSIKPKDKTAKEKTPKKTDAEKRADILAKFNREQESAIKLAGMLNDERAKQEAIEELNNKMAEKGYKLLDAGEESAVKLLVQRRLEAERLGEAMQSIYDDAIKPAKDYETQMQALDALAEREPAIMARKQELWQKMTDEYRSATDAMYEFRKATKQANELMGTFGADNAAAKAVQEVGERARQMGQAFTEAMQEEADAVARQQYFAEKINSALGSIHGETVGAMEDVEAATTAATQAYANGWISVDTYTKKLQQLAATQGRLNMEMNGVTQWTQPFKQAITELIAEMPTLAAGLTDVLKTAMDSSISGVSDSIANVLVNIDEMKQQMEETLGHSVSTADVLKEQFRQIAASIAQDMVAALIKLGIQWAIQATLGQSIAAGQMASSLAMNTALASTLAGVWAVPAALASLATSGANAGAAMEGIGLTIGAAQLAAGIGKVANAAASSGGVWVANGGLIQGAGTSRSDSIQAHLSDGEYVVNARATRENIDLLHAINSGAKVSGSNGGIKVNVINNASGVEHTVERGATPDEVRIIAKAVAAQEVRTGTGKQFQRDMANPNSAAHQAVTQRTTARSRRG